MLLRVALLMCCLVPAVVTASGLSEQVDRFAEVRFEREGRSQLAFMQRVAEVYEAEFGAAVRALPADTDALDALFRAAYTAQFYTHARAQAADLERIFTALMMLGAATDTHRAQLHEALVKARDFAAARAYATPEQARFVFDDPLGDSADAPTAWRMGPESATREAITSLPRIIVVSAAACGFSRAAMEAITKDPELGPLFAREALWLSPPDQLKPSDYQHGYAAAHPDAVIRIAHTHAEWPMLEVWNTPNFYFLRDGVVLERVESWPLDGSQRDAVRAAAQRAGLLPSSD